MQTKPDITKKATSTYHVAVLPGDGIGTEVMPDDAIDQVRTKDAILLGAVGTPGVPDHVSLWGMLIPLRRELHQYACVQIWWRGVGFEPRYPLGVQGFGKAHGRPDDLIILSFYDILMMWKLTTTPKITTAADANAIHRSQRILWYFRKYNTYRYTI